MARMQATALCAIALLLLGSCAPAPELREGRPTGRPTLSGSEPPSPRTAVEPPQPRRSSEAPGSGRPQPARLTIPALGIRGLRVVPYRGWTDDAAGTEIQNRGLAASPHGPRGGVGPGGVGNHQITAHRLSSTRAFEFLPDLRRGQRVHVVTGQRRYVYEIVETRRTSFRSAASLKAQRAPVPGAPRRKPRQAMITLSTCATLEDHAAGNYWADEFDNPEHRIDKIGRLVASRPL